MRRIERTNQFKRDYKRESRGRHRTDLDASLARTVGFFDEGLTAPLATIWNLSPFLPQPATLCPSLSTWTFVAPSVRV